MGCIYSNKSTEKARKQTCHYLSKTIAENQTEN